MRENQDSAMCENQDSAVRDNQDLAIGERIRLCMSTLHIDTVYSRRYISDFLET